MENSAPPLLYTPPLPYVDYGLSPPLSLSLPLPSIFTRKSLSPPSMIFQKLNPSNK